MLIAVSSNAGHIHLQNNCLCNCGLLVDYEVSCPVKPRYKRRPYQWHVPKVTSYGGSTLPRTLLAPPACYCRLFSLSLSLQAGVWLPHSNTPINISMLRYSPHAAHSCSRGTFTHYFILVLGRFEAWISAFSKCSFSILTPEELRFKRPWAFMSYLIWVHNSKSEFLDSIYLQKTHLDTILPQQHF